MRALNRPHAEGLGGEDALGSPQEHLHAFLRSLDAAAEGLPDRFVAHLERALAHYGVRAWTAPRRSRTPPTACSCPAARGAPRARRCARSSAATSSAARGSTARRSARVLDRLEVALAPREPALAELAREVRWRTCDEPALEAAREETYAEMAASTSRRSPTTRRAATATRT